MPVAGQHSIVSSTPGWFFHMAILVFPILTDNCLPISHPASLTVDPFGTGKTVPFRRRHHV